MSIWDSIVRFSYSRGLHQHLKGLSVVCDEGYKNTAIYQVVMFVMLGVSLAILLNYYYGFFNQSRFARITVWLLNVLIACGIVGFTAYFLAAGGLAEGRHCPDISFNRMDCSIFALTAATYTFVFCALMSVLVLKWASVANKRVPV